MAKKSKILNFKKARLKFDIKKFLIKMKIPLIILLALFILLGISAFMGKIFMSNISDSILEIPRTVNTAKGYPYALENSTFEKFLHIGERPCVLSSESLITLSSNASVINNAHIDITNPMAISKNGRALVYSNSANTVEMYSRIRKLCSHSFDGTVMTADVSRYGALGVVTTGEDSQCVLDVFNVRGKSRFRWKCSRDYISSCSVSDFGHSIAVSAVGVNNAELYSRIILFKTGKTESEFDIKLEGTFILKVIYTSFGKIIAIGDNMTVIINGNGDIVYQTEYPEEALEKISIDDSGNVLICYEELGGTKYNSLVLSSFGSVKANFTVSYMPSSAYLCGSKVYMSVNNEINVYNFKGQITKEIKAENNVIDLFVASGIVYSEENGQIFRYK